LAAALQPETYENQGMHRWYYHSCLTYGTVQLC